MVIFSVQILGYVNFLILTVATHSHIVLHFSWLLSYSVDITCNKMSDILRLLTINIVDLHFFAAVIDAGSPVDEAQVRIWETEQKQNLGTTLKPHVSCTYCYIIMHCAYPIAILNID